MRPSRGVVLCALSLGLAALLDACDCSGPAPSDGGADAGRDGGADASVDGGLDGGTDGGLDGGDADGGLDGGDVDGGLDGGADGGLDGGADGGMTARAWCAALAQARCARESGCGLLDATQAATCLGRLETACLDDLSRASVTAAIFDEAAAASCLLSVPATRCILGPLAVPDACAFHAVFIATAAPGIVCVDSGDCLGGFCFGTFRECSACRAFVAPGQPCNLTDLRCDEAIAWCGSPPDGGSPRCLSRSADGVPCGSSRECASGWCNWNGSVPDAGPDRCGRVPLGAPCGDADDCVGGAYCAGFWYDGATVTPGLCTPRVGLGQPCANHPLDDGCVEPATCLEGQCAVIAPYSLGAGAECERLTHCAEAYYCLGHEALQADGGPSLRSGQCTLRLDPGMPCDYVTYVDTDCEHGSTCGSNGACAVRQSALGSCEASYECREFLSCPLTGVCEPYHAVGESCSFQERCADGFRDGRCALDAGIGICAVKLPTGALCVPTRPDDCASGRCFGTDGGSPACQPACLP